MTELMSAATTQSLPAGTELMEYRVDSVLGIGAFGITYKAWDSNLDMVVAIKEYFPDELAVRKNGYEVAIRSVECAETYEWGLSSFIREGRTLAQFKHPGIVRVSRYFSANHTAYIVMDFEQGKSLGDVLKSRNTRLSVAELLSVVMPVLEGLKVVHDKHYLHCDIKPANIYVRDTGSPFLLDFGAARIELGSATDDEVNVLTPGYAPPEQYEGNQLGPEADIYAMGASMYRCLAGKKPLDARRRQIAISRGLADPFEPLVADRAEDADVYSLINDTLQFELKQRPRSVSELLSRLRDESREQPSRTISGFAFRPRRIRRNHKIIFTGPVGAGKTTAIQSLSDIPVLGTDSRASDMTRERKKGTTVAMDYGLLKMSDEECVHLYGTPGQERFDFMWEILTKGGIGLVIMLDNTRRDPFKDMHFFIKSFRDFIDQEKLVIGVTRMDEQRKPCIREYNEYIHAQFENLKPPVFEVDARSRADVSLLTQALLYSIDPGIQDYNV